MKKIVLIAVAFVSIMAVSCSKSDDATTSRDVNVNYVIASTNASRTQWEYTDKDGATQKGSLPGNAAKVINQNFHKPSTAYIKIKAIQNNINTNVSVAAYIINTANGDTLSKSFLSQMSDSVEVSISKLLN